MAQQNYDELLRQEIRRSNSQSLRGDGGTSPAQQAAITFNAQNGGPMSMAIPQSARQAAPQQQMQQQAPSNIQQSIASQVGENVPVPTARPDPNAAAGPQQMGDASVLEAMQGVQQTPIEQAIAQQMGDASVMEQMQGQQPTQAPVQTGASPAVASSDMTGIDPTTLIAAVAGLGGAAGIQALIQRWRMGDPQADQTIKATGVPPHVLELYANPEKLQLPAPPKQIGAPLLQLEGPASFDADAAAQKHVEQGGQGASTQKRFDNSDKNAKANVEGKGDRPSTQTRYGAKNLPTSRPKMKVK